MGIMLEDELGLVRGSQKKSFRILGCHCNNMDSNRLAGAVTLMLDKLGFNFRYKKIK
jgi:hypothetical protein